MTLTATLFDSLSIVIVVNHEVPPRGLLDSLLMACEQLSGQIEVVLVANGVSDQTALDLKDLTLDLPDTTCLFLGAGVETDLACLAGIENAIGDWILVPSITEFGIGALPAAAAAARQGYDFVIGRGTEIVKDNSCYGRARSVYFGLYSRMTGMPVSARRSQFCLLSRAAALNLAVVGQGEMLAHAESIGGGFPAKVIPLPGSWPAPKPRTFQSSWSKGMRIMLSSTSVPLRAATMVAVTASGMSLIYSLYVVLTYLLVPNVARGWTTLSLQISGMMFLFSIVLLLLSEYLIHISRAMGSPRRFVAISRELRSPQSRTAARLNVVDADGNFTIGAPKRAEGPRS